MGVLISLGGNRPNEFEWKRRNWYNLKLEFIHDARTKFLMRRVSTCVHYHYTGVNNSFFASLQQDMQWNHVVSHLIWVFLTVQNTERDGRKRLSCHINSVMSFEINGSFVFFNSHRPKNWHFVCVVPTSDHHIHILRRSSHFDPNFNYDINNALISCRFRFNLNDLFS